MKMLLAQANVARMLSTIDSPLMADFVANLDGINSLAERSEGFVWRLKEESNNATAIRIFDDNFIILNMSVWTDVDMLTNFVYRSPHVEIFKRRKEWFEEMPEMHMALWYVPADKMPTARDAVDRIVHLRKHGETPFAFSFRKKFNAEEMI